MNTKIEITPSGRFTVTDGEITAFEGADGNGVYAPLVLPENGVESIADGLFCDITVKGMMAFPHSIKRIGRHCFDGCTFDTLVLHEELTNIGDGAFAHSRTRKLVINSCTEGGYGGQFKDMVIKKLYLPDDFNIRHEHEAMRALRDSGTVGMVYQGVCVYDDWDDYVSHHQ